MSALPTLRFPVQSAVSIQQCVSEQWHSGKFETKDAKQQKKQVGSGTETEM